MRFVVILSNGVAVGNGMRRLGGCPVRTKHHAALAKLAHHFLDCIGCRFVDDVDVEYWCVFGEEATIGPRGVRFPAPDFGSANVGLFVKDTSVRRRPLQRHSFLRLLLLRATN
jgi:hypothetical protein